MERAARDFTFIDLFAGIGGMRLGFEAAGGQCVFTSEWDTYSNKTYRSNFPDDTHEIAGDITKISEQDIPNHEVLLAGFPCQPFSIAGVSKKNALGRPHGFECKTQGTLFFDVARIIAHKKPRAFLLENVKNLLSHDKGNTFAVIRDVLQNELGYQIYAKVIDARYFVPQHRERILIVGFREPTKFDWNSIPLPGPAGAPRLGSVLHRESVLSKYVLSDKLWGYLQGYAEKHKAKGNGFGCSVFGPADVARTLSARYYKDGSEILIARNGEGNPRRLTPRECARLMGYPDEFEIPVSDTRAYKQFGNSVVVPLIGHVAGLMKPWILDRTVYEAEPPRQARLF
jgi:DNA (cytosine-5)-methyltransferase 1